MEILFVCTGNTCRSPMAEAIFNKLASPDMRASSAGVGAFPGGRASAYSIRVLEDLGLDISNHQARQVTDEILQEADLIITMSKSHKRLIDYNFPDHSKKVYNFYQLVDGSLDDVADPFGASILQYERTRDEIYGLVKGLIEKLKED